MARVMFAPVGLYYQRVLKDIEDFVPERLYLLVEKDPNDVWYQATRDNKDRIVKELGGVYLKRTEVIAVDTNDFIEVFKVVQDRITKEAERANRKAEGKSTQVEENRKMRLRFDITSATLLARVALINLAMLNEGSEVIYVDPEAPSGPEDYPPRRAEDPGRSLVPIPVCQSAIYSTVRKEPIYRNALVAIYGQPNKGVDSHSGLLELMRLKKGQANQMSLTRALKDLATHGVVMQWEENRKKHVRLTLLGEAIAASVIFESSMHSQEV